MLQSRWVEHRARGVIDGANGLSFYFVGAILGRVGFNVGVKQCGTTLLRLLVKQSPTLMSRIFFACVFAVIISELCVFVGHWVLLKLFNIEHKLHEKCVHL